MMNSDLQDKLFERFPWAEAKDPNTGEGLGYLTPCWCGNGWFQLIWNMFEEIENVYKAKDVPINVVIWEIKEKYASMQTVLCKGVAGIHDVTEKYERLSEEVCESCGSQGRVRDMFGWLTVYCDTCFETESSKKPKFRYFDANGNLLWDDG